MKVSEATIPELIQKVIEALRREREKRRAEGRRYVYESEPSRN